MNRNNNIIRKTSQQKLNWSIKNSKKKKKYRSNLSLAGPNNNVVDWDENKLHKEAHKPHYNKSNSRAYSHLRKLCTTNFQTK